MFGIVILAVYAVLMIGVTLMFTRKTTDAEGFHVADRRIGSVIAAMSIAATWIWAPSLFTSSEMAYTRGIPGMFWFTVPNVLCLILFIPFAKRIRAQYPEGITLTGYMAERYHSGKVKGVYSFQLGALTVLSTAVQLLAGGKTLALINGAAILEHDARPGSYRIFLLPLLRAESLHHHRCCPAGHYSHRWRSTGRSEPSHDRRL